MICCRPLAWLEQFEDGIARFRTTSRVLDEDANGWSLWRRWQSRLWVPRAGTALAPGWVGYVGFEMARLLEQLPGSHREELGLPLMRLGLYDRAIVLDHVRQRALAVRAPGLAEVLNTPDPWVDNDWLDRWSEAAQAMYKVPPLPQPTLTPVWSQEDHEAAVRRAIEYIAAGDIYQVNLAQCLRLNEMSDPLGSFVATRRANPARYAALLRWVDGAVASFSPELFLEVRGRAVLTRPIKGTRPRSGDAGRDVVWRRALLGSAKERAELTMIVDLHRNDLGRVCEFGSVQVLHPRRVEAHPTVFHTVADVTGRLRAGCDALDLLQAAFPAGSITGVPKIRALEIVDELERLARGVYTGTVGVLGLDGNATFNVAIRTLQMRGDAATLYVGGGIVADSDPAAEYEETLDKARGILTGLGCNLVQSEKVTS